MKKSSKDVPWTEDEIRRLHEMCGLKMRIVVIAAQLGRTYASVQGVRRRIAVERERGIYHHVPHAAQGPSEQALEDYNSRLLASQHMSTTALLMGDPPPGYSAIDRRAQ